MISLILIILAAICNSIMDNITHHYYKSIFKNKDQRFWNPAISWDCAKKWRGYKFDAWHIFKSIMIYLIVIAICCYKTLLFHPFFDFIIFGLAWNLTFNLFYNHILNEKNKQTI